MSAEPTRDLMKGFGDAVVPVEDERTVADRRARALPQVAASLRAVAASNARRRRTRRVAVIVGIAAALTLGVASAAMFGAFIPSARQPPAPAPAPVGTSLEPSTEAPSAVSNDPNSREAPADRAVDAPTASPATRPRVRPEPSAAASETSTLSAQNRLLAAALDARRRNDDGKAIVFLNELLAKYPTSPLAQEARVERLRCLERLGQRGAAHDEAKRYLHDYPDGFARDEAKGQASPAPSARPSKP